MIDRSTVFIASIGCASLRCGVAGLYAIASVAAFVAYRTDKRAAERGGWRVSENSLHLLSLAGGWPGALVAQRVLRHKTRKLSFQSVFWMTVAANCAALVWAWSHIG